jgi:hypothetical protein
MPTNSSFRSFPVKQFFVLAVGAPDTDPYVGGNTPRKSWALWCPIGALFILIAFCGCVSPLSAQGPPNPIPLLNEPLVPTSAAPGGPGFTLTVNGTGFVSGAVVHWNGSPRTTSFISASQLTATIPASDIAAPGTASISVHNPAPGGGTSNVAFFGVSAPVTQLSFASFPQNNFGIQTNSVEQNFVLSPVTADFNGDGKLDIAVLGTGAGGPFLEVQQLFVVLGNGDGTFQVPVGYPTGNKPAGLIAGDFNGDGKVDLAVTNSQDNTVSIYLGNGDGTFQPQKTATTGGADSAWIVTGDFNGDGKLDLAVAGLGNQSNPNPSISILLGNGDGTFQSAVSNPISGNLFGLAVGDFNRDGKLDLAYEGSSTTSVLFGNGDGTFRAGPSVTGTSAAQPITADLNGDGKLDLIEVTQPPEFSGPGNIVVLLGNGDGSFQAPVNYPIPSPGSATVVAGDFNGDGKLDLATLNSNLFSTSETVSVLLGNGDGTFQSPFNFPTNLVNYGFPLVAGDFNGDGKTDLAVPVYLVLLQGFFPVASVSPSSLNFCGTDVVPTSCGAPQNLTLTNTGTAALTLSSISVTGPNAGDFAQSNACSGTLAVNASCQISVTFSPTAAGDRTASVSIADDALGSPQIVDVTATPTAPVAALSTLTVTFPNQTVGSSSLPQTVTLTNTGNALLHIASITTNSADFGVLNACGNTLNAGGFSCSIGVFFHPIAGGTRTGTLTITDDAFGGPQAVTLTGTGQDLSIAPGSGASATISPGQTASYAIAVSPSAGFNQSVAFSCTGAPALSMCTVSPSPVQLNGTSPATVTVTVTTTAPSKGFALPLGTNWPRGMNYGPNSLLIGLSAIVMIVTLFLWPWGQRLRWVTPVFACGILLWVGMTMTSCGGGTGGGSGSPGTQAGTYTLTVSASFTSGSTTLTRNTQLTLIVQ